jgi:hypothetical protein
LGFEITLNVNAIQTNQSIINKPGNWRETISIQMIDLQNNSIFLLPRSLEFCRTYWPNVNLTAQPKYYSDMVPNLNNANLDNTYGNSNWFIAPTTDQVYNFVIIYLGIPLFNADNSTNFLTQRYPDLLLYSCLIEACLFLDNEEKRNKYDTMFSKELETINNMNRNRSTDRTVIRENN